MGMRAGRILTGILFTALFLLMLSALVVAEPITEGDAPPQPHEPFSAVFAPRALPTSEQMTDAGARQCEREATAMTVSCTVAVSSPLLTRDANGFVLNASRYENCAYHIFRPEVAGG